MRFPEVHPPDISGTFDAPGADFRLAAEAQRIRLAGAFDPMLAVATSDVRPLPHQIRAVYGELLPRTPLRFLLADDPGAGKTIMAGLYIKELLLRGDLVRCLVVAPGGLVEQWQDELATKVGLDFEILPGSSGPSGGDAASVFGRHPLLIARMDQLARNDELVATLRGSEWDLVVVDEAHRMSAGYAGREITHTKRYRLGQVLGSVTRHLLLMTATPHAGKEEDFQLFLALLDPDRFEGRYRPGVHSQDTTGLMRRTVKEDLLTFEGKPLFPERIAETVPYELSLLEADLYEQVTQYVREEMNRADRLDGARSTTVGFALTVLQRRLASSPEAILRSLQRRRDRLRDRRRAMVDGDARPSGRTGWADSVADVRLLDDMDELDAARAEELEDEIVDAATAASTVAELDAELAVLDDLERAAARVRASGEDRKWSELRDILHGSVLGTDRRGSPRKLIVFTEHRDTLGYLAERIGRMLGHDGAVVTVDGSVGRAERRRRTEEFARNPHCQVLVATDAAGEGLNLQSAHLMVNYDLPWNPNRIEQRFGRIHRIGQEEVCRLWNLVAAGTREGQVFERLLEKVEEQRRAYGGRVFDVLGQAFEGRPLRELLIEAIRHGESPEVRARLHQVVDAEVAAGLTELLAERALASEMLAQADLETLRRRMDEARARRLQPHYVKEFFVEAFERLGGRMYRREQGRFEITNVPAALRHRAEGHAADSTADQVAAAGERRRGLSAARRPIATRYERVAFDPAFLRLDGSAGADLLAPGHPLLDAVVAETLDRFGSTLTRGAVLVDPGSASAGPQLLLAVTGEVVNGRGDTVTRLFHHLLTDLSGSVVSVGAEPPYQDFEPGDGWTGLGSALPSVQDVEAAALRWMVEHQLPTYGDEVGQVILAGVERSRREVTDRLNQQINWLHGEAMMATEQVAAGRAVRVRSATLMRRAEELDARLARRLHELELDSQLSLRPPRIVAAALVVPASMLADSASGPLPVVPPRHAVDTKTVERRAVEAVLAAERSLGRVPEEMPFNNRGYDIESVDQDSHLIHIEVKGRLAGAEDFFITRSEVMHGKNMGERYRLALVSVSPDGPSHDEVRYRADPFATTDMGTFATTGLLGNWPTNWTIARAPF